MTPERWAVLGQAIRDDRRRQGMTLQDLEARTEARSTKVSSRTIGTLERGGDWKTKPPSLEPTVAALGWLQGWTDRILAGEDPSAVLRRDEAAVSVPIESPRSQLLELVPPVYEFSRVAARLGAPAELRDQFDELIKRLLDSVPAKQSSNEAYRLAAYRPHAEGEGVPADDAARIAEVLNKNS